MIIGINKLRNNKRISLRELAAIIVAFTAVINLTKAVVEASQPANQEAKQCQQR